jgi:hypothetical protein
LVSSLAIISYLPGADEPSHLAAPGEGHQKILIADMAQRAVSHLTILVPLIPGFEHGVVEDQGGEPEIDAVLLDVAPSLVLVPLEAGHYYVYTNVIMRAT